MKLKVKGPVSNDGLWLWWQVIGPRGGVKAEFYTKKDAQAFIKRKLK